MHWSSQWKVFLEIGVPEKLDNIPLKYLWKYSFFTKTEGCRPATLQKMNSFTGIFQRFCLLFKNNYFKETFHWLLGKVQLMKDFFKYKITVLLGLTILQFIKKTLAAVRGVSSIIWTDCAGCSFGVEKKLFSIRETRLDLFIC